MPTYQAVFLDRDGVLIENVHPYVTSHSDVKPIPGSLEACERIRLTGATIIVVTNQACVGKGLIDLQFARSLNESILAPFGIVHYRLCPHDAAAGCTCRKPGPGMILDACEELGIRPEGTILVGDAWTDLQAADNAGIGRALVRTGRGLDQEKLMISSHYDFAAFDDLLSFTRQTFGD